MNTPRIQFPSPVRFWHISPFGSSSLSWSNPLIVGCIVIRIVISKIDTNYTCLKYQEVIVYLGVLVIVKPLIGGEKP